MKRGGELRHFMAINYNMDVHWAHHLKMYVVSVFLRVAKNDNKMHS